MDQLEGMRLFTRVVETGSFSEAARRTDLTPSSISRTVAALENDLGVRLLHRTTRRLRLTEAGQLYYERAAAIVQDVESARLALTQLENAPRGTLRLSAPIAFGRLHALPGVIEFLAQYPEMRVEMTFTDHFVDLVQEGVDLGIRLGGLENSTLIARKLAENRRIVCASPAYLKRHGVPKVPADLAHHNCLVRRAAAGRGAEWTFVGPEGEQTVAVEGSFQSNSVEALHDAARAGLGLVCLSTWILGQDVKSGLLRTVLDGYEARPTATEAPVYAVYPHNRHLSPKVRAFVDFLAKRLGPRPYWECGAMSPPGPAAKRDEKPVRARHPSRSGGAKARAATRPGANVKRASSRPPHATA